MREDASEQLSASRYSTIVSWPARLRARATARPTTPAPTTMVSTSADMRSPGARPALTGAAFDWPHLSHPLQVPDPGPTHASAHGPPSSRGLAFGTNKEHTTYKRSLATHAKSRPVPSEKSAEPSEEAHS